MAALGRMFCSLTSSFVSKVTTSPISQLYGMTSSNLLGAQTSLQQVPVRTRYVDWMMLRDVKRRQTVKEYAPTRLRVNALRKNSVLPKELQELADIQIASYPRNASITRLTNRCVVTSRARGKLRRWRVSRIVWRHLADYNKLSGVKRAHW